MAQYLGAVRGGAGTGGSPPAIVAELALDFLNHPEKLQQMRDRLRSIQGELELPKS